MQVYILTKDYTKLFKVHIIINLIHFSKTCDLVLKWQTKLKFEKSSVFQKPQLLNQVGHMIGFGMVCTRIVISPKYVAAGLGFPKGCLWIT